MKGKKENFIVAYNIQSAVDYDTKLICAINVTQTPTYHYELPNITEYGSEMQKAMNQKMEKQEYKDEYAKKSNVEGPFGIFKEQFQIEKEIVIGMIKTEERINLDALAYNLIRLYNIKQEIKNTTEDLEDFCKSTSKNQLKLDVTIF